MVTAPLAEEAWRPTARAGPAGRRRRRRGRRWSWSSRRCCWSRPWRRSRTPRRRLRGGRSIGPGSQGVRHGRRSREGTPDRLVVLRTRGAAVLLYDVPQPRPRAAWSRSTPRRAIASPAGRPRAADANGAPRPMPAQLAGRPAQLRPARRGRWAAPAVPPWRGPCTSPSQLFTEVIPAMATALALPARLSPSVQRADVDHPRPADRAGQAAELRAPAQRGHERRAGGQRAAPHLDPLDRRATRIPASIAWSTARRCSGRTTRRFRPGAPGTTR